MTEIFVMTRFKAPLYDRNFIFIICHIVGPIILAQLNLNVLLLNSSYTHYKQR